MGYSTSSLEVKLPPASTDLQFEELLLTTAHQADIYSHGQSEKIIAKALKQYNIPRNKVVILSKCYFGVAESDPTRGIAAVSINDGDMVNQVGLSRKHIFDAVEKSVERLGTYIDVLQIHRLDRDTPREEIMKALNDVIERGWVRYIGASSMAAWEFQVNLLNSQVQASSLISSRRCRILRIRMGGISSFRCRTTTTSSTVRKSVRW